VRVVHDHEREARGAGGEEGEEDGDEEARRGVGK
jgi:hypothetical protein